ncbi:sn-glycerol-3-phosphate import ATP-binding protein UgpC [Paraburkholderia silvatlantica]|uniref:sn-glycerol-3-phosphate import ATP-binding protein UgpC n=1 Tax=Paraburkholderia silvatlantica TaxID=321895 RepID=UPI000D5F2D75|nr:sn-glycerol-3-phosphate import ATP-binding protein UgpC [Paraburkholderia silvatlantica]PVY27197.1 glycerol 3-phosphate ABC transporter ATP-binding protein [Paraburkholderia silvatlantica]PXW34226.1 glycerol 3-phosphate ABC transporter ATP-binding protein [Paraburkholderia silvatlantica]TDQ85121.1 glycerol 3-phosphate ABC transporter ATP-binding protein [Paraburkholderia silvatlantica]
MAALSIRGVTKSYDGAQQVLHGIDVQVADGEFLVLVGPSGCGKSTLLRMVAGLETITAGEIAIGGKVVNRVEPKDRDIAMVFQNYALYPHMTVARNMGYSLKLQGLDRTTIEARVAAAAEILELGKLLERKPRELSGGQRQRVAMGRAIVREPSVFLFDEPLSNLDAKLRVQMRLEIQRLHARLGTTSLYVTHDQIEAMTLAQRVMVLNGGRAEQIGTPGEVYDRPASMFVASFIGSPAMNLLRGRVSDDGRRFESEGNGPHLPLGDAPAWLPKGAQCVLGVRPEHMHARGANEPVTLEVETCELLGADNLAHGRWGSADVVVRLPHETRPTPGERLAVHLPPARLHFFDPVTGKRLG